MSDVQLYLFEADRNRAEAESLARKTASRLESKEITLVGLVESLGEYLNNDDATIKTRTIAFLADVLSAVPNGILSRQQREMLNTFILTRISNGAEAINHSAKAIVALERLGRFDQQRVESVLNTLLDHASPLVQFKQQIERFEILGLFDVLFLNYRKELTSLHQREPKLVQRLLTCLDGEKDPRNLMIIFSILNIPMVEWDISADSQDMFDAVFNYFPITFRPPPNDPYGITAQDLKDRLRDCISSTGYFAPYSFPALLDKLESTSANVKRDALHALQACARRYGPSTVNLYSVTLWDAVKFEILSSQEEDLAEEALKALFEVGRTLSATTHAGPLQNYLKPICKECNEHLEDTPTKQSSASGRILQAVAESSAEAASIIVKVVFPQLLRFCQSSGDFPRRRGLFEVLTNVLQANAAVFGHWRQDESVQSTYRNHSMQPEAVSNPAMLNEFSEQILDIYMSAVEHTTNKEVSFRTLGLQGLESLALVRGVLSSTNMTSIVSLVDDIIISEEPYGRDEVKAKAIDVLVNLARQKPQLVAEHAFPAFLAELPDTDVGSSKRYVPILEAFAKLSAEPQVFNTIIIRLKNRLYAALRQGASTDYVNSILSAVLYAFQHGSIDLSVAGNFATYYTDIVTPLLKEVIIAGSETFAGSPALDSEALYDLIGHICNTTIRSQPLAAQIEVCRNIYTLFRDVDPANLPPFRESSSEQSLSMIVSTHLLAGLRTEAKPAADINLLLAGLVDYAQKSSLSPALTASSVAQIGLLVNKYVVASEVNTIVMPYLEETSQLLSHENVSHVSLQIAFAMVKALVLRADSRLNILVPNLVRHLANPTYGTFAARSLASLIAPDRYLTKDNHCKTYAIHRQRFFSIATPLLMSSYRTAASASDASQSKENYLIAMSGILQHVPYDLLQSHLEELTPALLQSLTLQDAEVQASALATISNVVLHDSKALESHVSSLISRLMDVATSSSVRESTKTAAPAPKYVQLDSPTVSSTSTTSSQPKVRAAALACLSSFVGSLKDESLVPYQRQTIKRLSATLDDPKRAVRAEAVRCRAAWLGLAGADEEDDY